MNLLRSAATVSGFTMISRVLGFVRDILIASVLGTGAVADAFFVAFKFPNLFRRLFAEGAFNAAFVPLFAKRYEGEGADAARDFAEQALSVLLTTLVLVTVVAVATMPWLMYVIAPGFADTPDKFDITILFTRIAFPYLLFMSLVALYSGVLNSMGRFAAAAAAPIVLNVILISVLAIVVPLTGRPGLALVWGVAVAGVAQFVLLVSACHRAGMVLHLRRPRLTPGVKRLVALGVPGILAGGIGQINLLLGTIIASLQDGAVSWLYYADRVYQLPLGVVGIAIGIVLLPDMSQRLRNGDAAGAHDAQNRALEISMLLTLPAAIALMVIPGLITEVLFERGAFGASDTGATSIALAAFALGLPAFVLIKVFSPGFFAREDTLTPLKFAAISVGVNVVASLGLFFAIGHVGIALATSAAAWVNAVLLAHRLHRLGHFSLDLRLKQRLPRILVAALCMGGALWVASTLLANGMAGFDPLIVKAFGLGIIVLGGAALYGVLAQAFGAAKFADMRAIMRKS